MQNKSVLEEAKEIIYGDREKTYGHPSKNLRNIGLYWQTYLEAKGVQFQNYLTPQDVSVMMILLKCARLANDPTHRDSVVDICGYAALIERCDEQDS